MKKTETSTFCAGLRHQLPSNLVHFDTKFMYDHGDLGMS